MSALKNIGNRQSIAIIYTRGTHYEVGFDVGRTFASLIQSFLAECKTFQEEYIPAYNTPEGRKAYKETLAILKTNYPQYVDELQGTADGAKVPFHELLLLHMDEVILTTRKSNGINGPTGCSSICVNQGQQALLGHTEDALAENLNHFYLVAAHIIPDKETDFPEEKFTSLCYVGHLPGVTMSYNHHGLVFSINSLGAKNLIPGRTPCHFLTRAMLAAENLTQVEEILKDEGCGAADGCSLNLTFLNQEGGRIFYNIEIAPCLDSQKTDLDITSVNRGGYLLHCNSYLRMPVQEDNERIKSSIARLEAFKKFGAPKTRNDVINMLGDTSNKQYPVFRYFGHVRTIAVGIFDCIEKTWTLYSDNPKTSEPLIILPLLVEKK